MALNDRERDQAIEWVRDLFANDLTRVILSVIILLSVLPLRWLASYDVVFFGFFAVEVSLRGMLVYHDIQRRSLNRVEALFLFFDVLATLSFLPIEVIWDDIRLLRLFRLSRMLLLLSFWGPMVREVGLILGKRERRYQFSFVIVTVLILAFTSAVVLEHFRVRGIDFNADGNPSNDHSFWSMLWWSFLQIESADNILKDPNASLGFFFSILLTVCGLFLFSFLIGIGNSMVEELVALSRERRMGLRRHTVIGNITPHSEVLLRELVSYYAKSFRSPRIITLGSVPVRYDYMHEGNLKPVRYRQGSPLSGHDLIKVDADRATRVILLGQSDRPLSDSEVVSQVLSVREVSPECAIYAEIFHARNIQAALEAGGARTVPIMASRLVSLFVANIIVFPGVEEVYQELLTSRGDEIYTCIFDEGAMAGRKPPSGPLLPFGELLDRAHRAHGVVLLGHLLRDDREPTGFSHALLPGTPLADASFPAVAPVDQLRGFFGVAANFEGMKNFVDSLPDVSSAAEPYTDVGVPTFGVCPGASALHSLLICGFHEGLVDFCEELILFSRVPRIFLMVPESCSVESVVRLFADRAVEPGSSAHPGTRTSFVAGPPGKIHYFVAGEADRVGTIQILRGDWSDERVLLEQRGSDYHYRLEDIDAVLLTYVPDEADPDARTALAFLKLMRMKDLHHPALRPGFRLFCEAKQSDKATLFQRRFRDPVARQGTGCPSVSIVAAESSRNAFLAQAVFVPGIVTIYRELLSQHGVYLCKLLPEPPPDPTAPLTFGQLLSVLYRRDGFILIGVELADSADRHDRRLVVNPAPRHQDYSFSAGQLTAIYAVGGFANARTGPLCPGCFAR
jgi:hypothetical protein